MNALLRRTGQVVAPVLLLALAGCYTMREHEGGKTYSVAWWFPLTMALAGLVFLGLGIRAFRRFHKPIGILLMIFGPFLTLAVPPMMLLNKVTVDDQHFEVVDCFLWNLERNYVVYDEVLGARLDILKTQTQSAGEVKKYTLELTMKNGQPQSIVVKNAFKEAWPEVARQLRARGFTRLPEQLPE